MTEIILPIIKYSIFFTLHYTTSCRQIASLFVFISIGPPAFIVLLSMAIALTGYGYEITIFEGSGFVTKNRYDKGFTFP